ncbi:MULTISPECIES: PTS sugar transporter subunit IIA [Geobacillus]|jgi:PTS system galactitol-specific IIA component|uniref:PTS sugar transporter subunit IIA n=1 Tax=Geobacillus TaxID=129337 RepID=UPI000421DABB|nr:MULTISPECIES: PTS sugar transporter subunit IIA [Geobacillus]ARA98345.1 PTS sugar transporter subunit IIA [Geobacillus thermodenitrificans]KQB91700.1 PTS sugar transporter subunit IIA [Geobacillus sp. PA-3]MED3716383.1 PTS sugar transporter subunit IIA [Geobacillus thermodenitrificans]MED4918422.1 PTS sugar transporter subunit IIA [Geobacillus thermodenitrificans]
MRDITFDESLILYDLEAETNEEVLTKMARNLASKHLVKESYILAVIERERAFPTGLPTQGISVAIPHTDIQHVNQKAISVAILKQPVEFGVMGENDQTTPVQIVFMLAMDEAHAQPTLLQKLMQLIQDEQALKYILMEKNKVKLKHWIRERLGIQ